MTGSRIGACAFVVAVSLCFGLESRFSGLSSARVGARWDTAFAADGALRYIPALSLNQPLSRSFALDLEASANAWASAGGRSFDAVETDWGIEPYRLWLRLAAAGFEARAGLQRISFGQAVLLRPLMWFDGLDPNDPLQLTSGVWGLLGRQVFANNVNLWAWGLLGNEEPRGWEPLQSERWRPEVGGRVQTPVPAGELAASWHYRRARLDWPVVRPPIIDTARLKPAEHRFGLDAKLDLGVGVWLEAVAGFARFDEEGRAVGADTLWPGWRRSACVGVDYTFGIGNGLTLAVEHFRLENALGVLSRPEAGARLTGLSAAYPLGLLDNLRGLVFFDWENSRICRTLSWQHTLDRWSLNASAFWNPDSLPASGPVSGGGAGKGLALVVSYSH
ncbi:MAG: hypothetical protein R6X13_08125 [bacterium]